MAWTFAATKAGYGNLWRSIKIKPGDDFSKATKFARRIIANEARYRGVQARTGVPWYFVGALHMRESSCDFSGVLHNGDKIIGTGRKTYRVPSGRGPFASWEAAADDALRLKNLHNVREWSPERMGYEAERFNGLGYVGKGVNSSYLWAGSNHEQPGKYIADHVWSSTADDPQIGVMTVLKRLCELRPDIDAALNGSYVPPPPDVEEPEPTPEPRPKPTKPVVQSSEMWAQLLAIITAVGSVVTDVRFLTLIVVLFCAYQIWRRWKRGDLKGWFKS